MFVLPSLRLCLLFFAPWLVWGLGISLISYSANAAEETGEGFVRVEGKRFFIDDKPYFYVGTNMWFGAYLGSSNPQVGDRKRLLRELDLLKRQGITNLRILGASEASTLKNSMKPAILNSKQEINQELLEGLDFLLDAMAKRNMKAVIYLNNFWEWSGGMATYLSWVRNGEIVDMADPTKPWPAFALFSAQFYSEDKAVALFNRYVRYVLSRKNTVNGKYYKDDPTIMSWQLANEPRPGDGKVSHKNLPSYYRWIKNTTQLIKSLAPRHLVSVGSEGTMGCLELEACVVQAHQNTGIDYVTFHMWLKNWGWFDVNQPETTFPKAIQKAEAYVEKHLQLSDKLKMPLVLEEFGLERDGGGFAANTAVSYRDTYFKWVFGKVEQSIKNQRALVGTNFWAWGGYGRAQHPNALWQNGDKAYVGDPPQEPQGLNSVFDSDKSTLHIISQHKRALEKIAF